MADDANGDLFVRPDAPDGGEVRSAATGALKGDDIGVHLEHGLKGRFVGRVALGGLLGGVAPTGVGPDLGVDTLHLSIEGFGQ